MWKIIKIYMAINISLGCILEIIMVTLWSYLLVLDYHNFIVHLLYVLQQSAIVLVIKKNNARN